MAVELLGGILTGAGSGAMQDASGWRKLWGGLLLVLDPATFDHVAAFKTAVGAYLAEVKGSRLAPGVAEVRIPGDAYRTRRAQLEHGVVVDDSVWQNVAGIARGLGVDPGTGDPSAGRA